MIVKSNKEVNIRTFEPYRRNDNIKGILNPGFEVEVEVVEGQDIDGNSKWYKDKNGDYYWSGGFEEKVNTDNDSSSSNTTIIENFSAIRETHLGTGKGVKIAILDSGIDASHTSIKKRIIQSKNFLSDNSEIVNAHGTKVAGIIVANEVGIKGLATDAQIIDYRVVEESGRANTDAVIDALKYIDNNNVDVKLLNLSLDINSNLVAIVQNIINKLFEKKIYCVVAGDSTTNTARLKNVIKVCVDKGQTVEINEQSVCISFTNSPVITTTINGNFSDFKDSSAYTAVVTGLVARIISNPNYTTNNFLGDIGNFFLNNINSLKI